MKKRTNKGLLISIGIIVLAVLAIYFIKNNKLNKNENYTKEQSELTEDINENTSENKTEENMEDKDSQSADEKAEAEITNSNFYIETEEELAALQDSDKPLMLMFGTPSCVYCNTMRPYVQQFADLYQESINIRYVDAQETPDLAYKYPIRGVPAFMYKSKEMLGYTPSDPIFQQLSNNGNQPSAYSESDSDQHDFTMTFGMMDEDLTRSLIEDLISHD